MSQESLSPYGKPGDDGFDTAEALMGNLRKQQSTKGASDNRIFPGTVFTKSDEIDTGKAVEGFFRRTFGPLELGFYENGEPDDAGNYSGLEYYDFLVGFFDENRAIKNFRTEAINLSTALDDWKKNTGISLSLQELYAFSVTQRDSYLTNWFESPQKQKDAFLEVAHDWETVGNIVKTAIAPEEGNSEINLQQIKSAKEAYAATFLYGHFSNENFAVTQEDATRLRDGLRKWVDERMEYARETGVDGDEDLKDLRDLSLKDVLRYAMNQFGFWVIKSDGTTTKKEYDKAQDQVSKWLSIMELSMLAAKESKAFNS